MTWVESIVDNNYEIYTEYPYQIRRKSNKRIIKEYIDNGTGYIRLNLNKKQYYKHRIIALQFIPNPNNYNEVDHKNHDKTDYHISNLRWVSSSQNKLNKSSNLGFDYEFFDDIDDDCIIVDRYNNHEFENYYYDDKQDVFYFFNGVKYRKLKINYLKNGSAYVNMIDNNNKQTKILYSVFKKQYDLI